MIRVVMSLCRGGFPDIKGCEHSVTICWGRWRAVLHIGLNGGGSCCKQSPLPPPPADCRVSLHTGPYGCWGRWQHCT